MAARDIYHDTVRRALEKDGWVITQDPFALKLGGKNLLADLGAERLISAEKGKRQIIVEIKSFLGPSNVKDLEQALGQYVLYSQAMRETQIDRELYLAVSHLTFKDVFTIRLGQVLLDNQIIKLMVFNHNQEVIERWIPD